jgi:hypothetical protein
MVASTPIENAPDLAAEGVHLFWSTRPGSNRRPPRWQGDAGVDFIEEFRPKRSYRVVSINSGGSQGARNLLVRPAPRCGRTSVTSPPDPQVRGRSLLAMRFASEAGSRRRIPTRRRSITCALATGIARHIAAPGRAEGTQAEPISPTRGRTPNFHWAKAWASSLKTELRGECVKRRARGDPSEWHK